MRIETVSIPVGKDRVSGSIPFTEPFGEKTGIIIAHAAENEMWNVIQMEIMNGTNP